MDWNPRMDNEIEVMSQQQNPANQRFTPPPGPWLTNQRLEDVSPQSPEKVKRPMNAFMIWSTRERSRIRQEHSGIHNSVVSSMLGERWKFLPEAEKSFYFKQAELLRAKHKRDHPNYKYQPDKFRKKLKRPEGPDGLPLSLSSFFPTHPPRTLPQPLTFPSPIQVPVFPDPKPKAAVPAMVNPLHFPPTRDPQRGYLEPRATQPSQSRQEIYPRSTAGPTFSRGIRCVVRNCGNESTRSAGGLRFARFPRNLRLRGVWCRLTGLFLEDSFVKEPYVCADHFEAQSTTCLPSGTSESVIMEGLEFPTLGLPIPDSYIVDIISGSWAVDLAQRGPFAQSRALNVAQIQDISHSDPDQPLRDNRSPEPTDTLEVEPPAKQPRNAHSPSPDNSSDSVNVLRQGIKAEAASPPTVETIRFS